MTFRAEEYLKMKDNYTKALSTMQELNLVELERLRMSAPISYDELIERHDQQIILRFQAIHESYLKQGKTREKYMERLALEFREEGLAKADLELIDSYLEHRRWFR